LACINFVLPGLVVAVYLMAVRYVVQGVLVGGLQLWCGYNSFMLPYIQHMAFCAAESLSH